MLGAKDILPYNEAQKKSFSKLSAALSKKLEKKAKLTRAEQGKVLAFDEMREDIAKAATERRRGVVVFKENYEMLSVNDVQGFYEQTDDENEPGKNEKAETEPAKRTKDKKKQKASTLKKKSQAMKKTISKQEPDPEQDADETDGSDSESKDGDFETELSPKGRSKPSARKKEKIQKSSRKTEEAGKPSAVRQKKGVAKSNKTASAAQKRKNARAEPKAFADSERLYRDLIERWEKALKEERSDLMPIVKQVTTSAPEFSASFTRIYQVPQLLKQTKIQIKESGLDIVAFQAMRDAIKLSYERRMAQLPDGYTPSLTKSPKRVPIVQCRVEDVEVEAKNLEGETHDTDSKLESIVADVENNSELADSKRSFSLGHLMQKDQTRTSEQPSSEIVESGDTQEEQDGVIEEEEAIEGKGEMDEAAGDTDEAKENDENGDKKKPEEPPIEKIEVNPRSVLPVWMTNPVQKPPLDGDDRSVALEAILEATILFPKDTKATPLAVAVAIEEAIWQTLEYPGDPNSQARYIFYWKKIDKVVASLADQQTLLSLGQLLLLGHFESPEEFATVDEKIFQESWRGGAVYEEKE